MHKSPKKIEIRDMETDEVVEYPSMYKTGKAMDQR